MYQMASVCRGSGKNLEALLADWERDTNFHYDSCLLNVIHLNSSQNSFVLALTAIENSSTRSS